MYKEGEGITQYYPLALEFLKSAAEQGHSDAQYHYGEGVKRNYDTQHSSGTKRTQSKDAAKP